MKIEILTIGDEILSGDILDTNKQYLSNELWQIGFEITRHTSIRDDEQAITNAILAAQKRADAVICTGGLGPTRDDFTIEIAAKTFGVECEFDQKTLELLQKWYKKQNREIGENNKKQALIPIGGKALHNRFGTAPGVYYCFNGVHFYFLPGVPKEMKTIFQESIFSDLINYRLQSGEKKFYATQKLYTFGVAESQLDRELKPLFDSRVGIGNVRIGYRVRFPNILLKLSAWGESQEQADNDLAEGLKKVKEVAGKYIFSESEERLEKLVIENLIAKKQTLAVAESCTGGLLSSRLTDISGSSEVFLGGFVTYSNELKRKYLNVDDTVLNDPQKGAVSEECAQQMVLGLRDATGADFCIAITGIAGPTGGSEEKPVGTVYMASLFLGQIKVKKFFFPFPREMFKKIISSAALSSLLNFIRK